MSLPADLHMHTPLCRHAVGEPVDYARHAVQLGLTEIGFSDHSPMSQDDFDNWRMFDRQLDEYVAKVRLAQKEFPRLTIKLALEVDYLPGHEDWIRKLAARHPWDYFIGSVHYVSDSWDIDNPAKLSEWKKRDTFEVWTAYFDRLTMDRTRAALLRRLQAADAHGRLRAFFPRTSAGRAIIVHSKVAVIDDEWSTVGSSNLDPMSLALNLEANVFVRDRAFNEELAANLEHLMRHACSQVTERELGELGGWSVVRSFLAFHVTRLYPHWARWLPRQVPRLLPATALAERSFGPVLALPTKEKA